MKKFFQKEMTGKVLGALLFIMAVVTSGGMALAVAVAEHGTDTADPNAGKPLETATPDSPNKGLEQQSHASTGSALDEAGITENHIDDYVSKFRAYRFPLHTDMWRKARQIKVDTKEPTNWEVGEAVMEFQLKGGIGAASNHDTSVTITKGVHIYNNDWNLIRAGVQLMFATPLGYQGTVPDGSPLIMYVLSKGDTTATLIPLNGYEGSAGQEVPGDGTNTPIAATTSVFPMAPAMSESEVEIEPNNAMPLEKVCYLQKKVCAITYTELFQRIKKKANWNVQDIKDWNLEMFRRECTRSMLISAPRKFYKTNARTGTETCYTENGILRQMRLGYEISDSQIDFSDLIGIQAMLCGKYDTPNELTAYCGTKFIQRLLNIDLTKHKEYVVRNYTDTDTMIKITSFESNFGKINFVHEYALNDIGYSECAIIFSPEDAKHFYYQKGKTLNIDHAKGEGGEVREAKSQYYIQDDCIKVDTFNSMIVGPSTLVGGYSLSALDAVIKSVNELPSAANSAAVGDIVYLIQDVLDATTGAVTNAMGLYKCTSVDGTTSVPTWSAYDGKGEYIA